MQETLVLTHLRDITFVRPNNNFDGFFSLYHQLKSFYDII